MICCMSVVCEWIDWFIAVEIWGWCNEVYGLHTVRTVRTVHLVQLCIELCNNWHYLITHSLWCAFQCCFLRHIQVCLLSNFVFFFFSFLSVIFVLPHEFYIIWSVILSLFFYCNSFLRFFCIQLLVSCNCSMYDAAVGVEMLAYLWRKDAIKCVLLVNAIQRGMFKSDWLFNRLIYRHLDCDVPVPTAAIGHWKCRLNCRPWIDGITSVF